MTITNGGTRKVCLFLFILLLIAVNSMHINIDLSNLDKVTAPRFLPLYKNKFRNLHLCGGAGSTKSHFAAQKLCVRILAGMKTGLVHNFVALRKTQPAVRKSVYTLLENKIADNDLHTVAKCYPSDLTVRFANGSKIMCAGLDDPMKLKSIEKITGFWLEEATEFTKADRQQVDLRLRGDIGTYKQILETYNPMDMNHHLFQNVHKKLGDDFTGVHPNYPRMYMHHSTYHDNPFIDQEYIDVLEGLKDEDVGFHKIYTLGRWGALKNLIYGGKWQSVDTAGWPVDFEDACYGFDFGYNNPSALVFIGILDGVPYMREIIYQTKLTNTQLIEKMDELGVNKEIPIYADSAEPARIEEIADAGYDCKPAIEAKKPHAVKARIDFCKRSHFRVDAHSPNVIKELSVYKYKEDRDGNVFDEPVKFMDHAMNAFEYGYYEHCRMGMTMPGIAFLKS